MKIYPVAVLCVCALTLLTACGTVSANPISQSPNVREIFLEFVPLNEPGAPHNLEWLVEHDAADGGYYGTKYFPGTLTIKKHANTDIHRYTTQQTASASGNIKTIQKPAGITLTWNNVIWKVEWKLNNQTYDFALFQTKKNHAWDVIGFDSSAALALTFFP